MHKFPFICLLFFFLYSCGNEAETWTPELLYKASFGLQKLQLYDDGWMAGGGDIWETGMVIVQCDTTDEIRIDTVMDASVFALDQLDHGPLVAGGIFQLARQWNQEWTSKYINQEHIVRDLLVDGEWIYAAGGAGLGSGSILKYKNDLTGPFYTELVDRELSAIAQLESSIFVAGFGAIYILNEEDELSVLDVEGDHFIDIEATEQLGVIALGATGTVLQSNDMGASWATIRKGSNRIANLFTDLELTSNEIYLCSEKELIYTFVDDLEWKKARINEIEDLKSIQYSNGFLYFASVNGEVGRIAR